MNGKQVLILIALCGFLQSCFNEIELDIPENASKGLYIEGNISRAATEFVVFFSAGRTASVNDPSQVAELLEVTKAYLMCNQVAFPEFNLTNNETTRIPIADFADKVELGDQPNFSLQVELADGRRFASAKEILFPVPKANMIDIDTVRRSVFNNAGSIESRRFIEFKISTPLIAENGELAKLKWDMEAVFEFMEMPAPEPSLDPTLSCYIPHAVAKNQISLYDGGVSTEPELIRFPLLEMEIDYKFAFGFLITIYQQSLSSDAFEFWEQARLNASQSGSVFDPVPGEVKSNIRNIDAPEEVVSGYFYATSIDTIRRLITPLELNYPLPYCRAYTEDPACLDCTLIRNSSLEKPDYWIE